MPPDPSHLSVALVGLGTIATTRLQAPTDQPGVDLAFVVDPAPGKEPAGSSKRTTIRIDHSGTEIWLDHTAVTGFVVEGGEAVAKRTDDGRTPRMLTHYLPLYRSLLSPTPDPILGFDAACAIVDLLHR